MKFKHRYKILIGFIITPTLSLILFGFIYCLTINSSEAPPAAVFIFMTLSGVLGLWLLVTLFLRAKRIDINDNYLTISKLFLFKMYSYKKSDVLNYNIDKRTENPFMKYEILQFKTSDNKFHSVISYEFKRFDLLKKWIIKSNAQNQELGITTFIKNEYLTSFFIAILLYIGFLIPIIL